MATARSVLGSESFVEKYRRRLTSITEKINASRDKAQANQLRSRLDVDRVIGCSVPEIELLSRYYRGSEGRQVLFYLCSKYCRGRYNLTELSNKFEISPGGLSSSIYKLKNRLKNDKKLAGKKSNLNIK